MLMLFKTLVLLWSWIKMIESPKGDEARSPDLVVFTMFTFGYSGLSVAVGKLGASHN
jgi:hypothetical protein